MELPLPMPVGMTRVEIEGMTINEGGWRESNEFVCAECQAPALLHPYTNMIWGCRPCGFTTFSVSVFFRLKQVVPAQS